MKNMFNVTTVLPHNLVQTNHCIHHNFLTQVFRKCAAQLHYVSPELRYIFWPPWPPCPPGSFAWGCEAKRWSHWKCSSLGTIFQPMRINSVPNVKCFCNNKNVLRAQSMVWHFVRQPVPGNEFCLIFTEMYKYLNGYRWNFCKNTVGSSSSSLLFLSGISQYFNVSWSI